MTPIQTRLAGILADIPTDVSLVVVSKFHPVDHLRQAYDAGQRRFGESRLQELAEKIPLLPSDVVWHFIGHLQTNKVRRLVALRPALIESIDSERLLRLVDSESLRAGVVTRVLMQIHVAAEETKFGFTPSELLGFFRRGVHTTLQATHICGVMGMASNTDNADRVLADFRAIRHTFDLIAGDPTLGLRGFDIVSMGMSHDYPLAITAGATQLRIGSTIFGPRTLSRREI